MPDKLKLGIAILASALAIYLTLILWLAGSEIAGMPTLFIRDGRAIGGELGALTVKLFQLLGYGAFSIPLGLFYFSWHLVAAKELQGRAYPLFFQLISAIVILSSAAGLANLMSDNEAATGPGGGIIGSLTGSFFTRWLSREFSAIILFLLLLSSLGAAVRGRWWAVIYDLGEMADRTARPRPVEQTVKNKLKTILQDLGIEAEITNAWVEAPPPQLIEIYE
jgi:hypothetical protein